VTDSQCDGPVAFHAGTPRRASLNDDMNDREIQAHLRSASDAILVLLAEVEQLELHKRGIRPADPRFSELAKAVRDSASALAEFAQEEKDWADDATAADGRLPKITDSPTPQQLGEILARWRLIERQLNEATPGSPEATILFDQFQQVREEYMTAFKAHSAGESAKG
jgi:hypothetical protein